MVITFLILVRKRLETVEPLGVRVSLRYLDSVLGKKVLSDISSDIRKKKLTDDSGSVEKLAILGHPVDTGKGSEILVKVQVKDRTEG